MRQTIIFIFLGLIVVVNCREAKAYEKMIFKDSFSNLDNWQEVFNAQHAQPQAPCRGIDSDKMQWEAINGQANLNISHSSPCKVVLLPKIGNLPTESVGVEFVMEIDRPDTDRNWIVHWQDKDNYLGFHLFDQVIYLEKYIDGVAYSTSPDFVRYNFQRNQKYLVKIIHQHPKITLLINNELVKGFTENSDDPINVGSPGLAGSVGAARDFSWVAYDDFRVFSLTEEMPPALSVPLIKQTNPSWSTLEYDHALDWNPDNPGIGRWGCALTSAVMVLNYHGLTKIPTNQDLNPASLNNWLKNQPDGYVGNGLLNWRALSRLSQQIAEQFSTPKLEMRFANPGLDMANWVKRYLSEGLPPIMALADHFVVATGALENEEFSINDPGYSMATRPITDFFSARLLTPSFTDLSAITIYVPAGVHFEIVDENENWTVVSEYIPGTNQLMQIFDLPKPEQSNYEFVFSNPGLLSQSVEFYSYDQTGEIISKQKVISPQTTSQTIELHKNELDAWQFIDEQASWNPLDKRELVTWLVSDKLKSPWLIEHILADQMLLEQATSLELAAQQLSQINQRYQLLQANKWLSPKTQKTLSIHWQRQLLHRFP